MVKRPRLSEETVVVSTGVELAPSATVRQLRGAIVEQYPTLIDVIPHVRFAVNSDYAVDATAIPATAEIAMIPPVSGG